MAAVRAPMVGYLPTFPSRSCELPSRPPLPVEPSAVCSPRALRVLPPVHKTPVFLVSRVLQKSRFSQRKSAAQHSGSGSLPRAAVRYLGSRSVRRTGLRIGERAFCTWNVSGLLSNEGLVATHERPSTPRGARALPKGRRCQPARRSGEYSGPEIPPSRRVRAAGATWVVEAATHR